MRPIIPVAAAVALASSMGADPRAATDTKDQIRLVLRDSGGLTEVEWRSVQRGDAVAKILDTDAREVAVAGVIRIAAPAEHLVTRVREVENLARSEIVLDVGRFGRPPAPADLARTPIAEYSLDLRGCRTGDCRVRLSADDIARFHREVNWAASDWRLKSAALWRDVLSSYAAAYAQDGRRALPVFANKSEPLSVASELSALAAKFDFVGQYSPEFHRYLQEFGHALPPGAEDMLYWTREDFGIRPVFRISHQVVYPARNVAGPLLVATNQVYADHYLDAALGVMLALPDPEHGRTFYMLAVNRARTRSLSGILRRMVRGTVQGRSRDAMRKILIATKSALESTSHRDSRPAAAQMAHEDAPRFSGRQRQNR